MTRAVDGWVMSHAWMSHVMHMNESCHTYEWVLWHVWMRHVSHVFTIARVAGEWVMSHVLRVAHSVDNGARNGAISHITHMNESYLRCVYTDTRSRLMSHVSDANMSSVTYKWGVVSFMSMSHVTCENESCHMWEWVTSHLSHVNQESCLSCQWVMSYMRMSHVVCAACPVDNDSFPYYTDVNGWTRYVTYEWVMHHTGEWVLPHMNE